MNTDEIIRYCLSKDNSYLDFPFGEIPACVKVANRLFAQIYPKPSDRKITLNCDRLTGELYKNTYPGTVVRGYHCPPVQQPYFITIYLNDAVAEDELKKMIDHSHSVVVGKLTKKEKKRLSE